MASHMTKLMRRLAAAGLDPQFEVFAVAGRNEYQARAPRTGGTFKAEYGPLVSGDSPESAIAGAVEVALAEVRRK